MESDRDIYKPPAERKPDEPLANVDVVPQKERAANLWRALGFLLFSAVVVGVAAWLFGIFAERGEREDLEDYEWEPAPARAARSEAGVRATRLDIPEDEWQTLQQPAPEGMDPALVAEALSRMRLCIDYLRDGDLQGAEEAALQTLQIWPGMPHALSALGFITTQLGQFDRAIRYLNAAIEGNPFAPDTYNTLATVHMQRGEFQRAEELFLTAMQLQPGFVRAYKNMGMLYAVMGQFQAAADYFLLALEQTPNDTAVRNNLGVAYFRLGRPQDARAEFQQLIDSAPEEPTGYFNMASTYAATRQFDEALHWIQWGSELCAPVQFFRFIASMDFAELREQPEFQSFQQANFPDVPMPVRP